MGDTHDTAAKDLNVYNTLQSPNVFLLQIICTLTYTISTCDYSISVIKRQKTYLKAIMVTREFALMHIHYDMQLGIDKIDIFARFYS